MLRALTIKDFAIIDEISVEFGPGLTALTGETGAGKSILIDALGLLLGGRALGEYVRTGAKEAVVEGLFALDGANAVIDALKARELFEKGDELVIRRTISVDGPNRATVNGRMATVATLEEITRRLVDVFGQHEHHSLLDVGSHLDFLDGFGALKKTKADFDEKWRSYKSTVARIRELEKSEANRAARIDYLRFVVGEIEKIDPKPGEAETLTSERDILRNSRMLIERAGGAFEALYGDDDSVASRLRAAEQALADAARIDPKIAEAAKSIESARITIEDSAYSLKDYAERIENDPAKLEEIEDRIESLNRLAKKYGGSVEAALEFAERSRAELADLEGGEQSVADLASKAKAELDAAKGIAAKLTAGRKKAAESLRKKIEGELDELGMKKTRFEARLVASASAEGIDDNGAEGVEFFISPNVGEDLKPLVKIASGGELSRIMLALKTVMRIGGGAPTLVFDEIDSGVGGAAAEVIGEKMKELSEDAQVLCVTHLPQIASFASNHVAVRKSAKGGRTTTSVSALGKPEREDEIARMLGGAEITGATKALAAEMIARARKKG